MNLSKLSESEIIELIQGKSVAFDSYYKYNFVYKRSVEEYNIIVNYDIGDDPYGTSLSNIETYYYDEDDKIQVEENTIIISACG